ncbi:hypothetical protein CVT26_012411 [Gymnopilus dilepis]|uniref:Uncharacterized protein n=1 Tax=Gymnopilus dilepis TaxID=231916 RepID=A0A409YQH6_9AGAR|nr:hypothetical protein CVT26_012411 [Gymnopilus dilepis]
MTAADLCFWFSTGFGDMNTLNRVNLTPFDTPLLCSIIAWVVQCFYAFRVYMLRASLVWVSVLIVLAYTLGEFSRFDGSAITRPAQVWFLTGIICDILIAVTLVWLDGGVYKCTTLITGKLYSNALLATLNNRIIARRLEMDDIVFQDMGSLYAASDKTASVGNSEV